MKTKTLKLLELCDDKENITTFIDKYIEDNPIRIYRDYNDNVNEWLPDYVLECNTKYDFEDKIWDSYSECISDWQNELAQEIEKELKKKYPDFDGLSEELSIYIQDWVCDTVEVILPTEEYLKEKMRVNLFIKYEKSDDAEIEEYDKTTLAKILDKLGYEKSKTLLKGIELDKFDREDKFLRSIYSEIMNCYKDQFNYICFIGTITPEQYYKWKENPNTVTFVFDKNHTGGFVDPYNGGGSVLDFDLDKHELSVKGSNIFKIIIENTKQRYSVDEIYGLTSSCYQPITVI